MLRLIVAMRLPYRLGLTSPSSLASEQPNAKDYEPWDGGIDQLLGIDIGVPRPGYT
jgi:hypothetical protein